VRGDETPIDTDAALLPLQAAQQQVQLINFPAVVAGQVRSVAGQTGPDITVSTAAATNGVAISLAAAANNLTLGLTGIGQLASKNRAANIAKLNQTTSNPPTQAEVQAVADKIDEMIDKLIAAGIIS